MIDWIALRACLHPKPHRNEPKCESCKAEEIMICLNGQQWLCWDCYCAVMKGRKRSPGPVEEVGIACSSSISARSRLISNRADDFLTEADVLAAHAEHGQLDFDLVKKAMGPNWPKEWEALNDGESIFALPERRP